jgi:hypothetical protein
MFALAWQGMSMANAEPAASDLTHAVLHWETTSHHHHDDGSHHQDQSSESAQHMAAEQTSASPAIVSASSHAFFLLVTSVAESFYVLDVPDPFASRLFRPPRPSF